MNLLKPFFLVLFLFSSIFSEQDSLKKEKSNDKKSVVNNIDSLKEDDKDGFIINFDNVSLNEYVKWISEITNNNFVFDSNDLDFKISIVSKEPTSIDVIMSTLLQILRIRGLSLLEQGNNIIIHKNPDVKSTSSVISSLDGQRGSSISTKVFKLKNINPSEVKNIISSLLSKDSIVEASETTRHIIVTDITSNILKLENILEDLDSYDTTLKIDEYEIRDSDISTLTSLVKKILEPIKGSNPLVFVPYTSSNKIFIVSTPFLVKRSKALFEELDNKKNNELLDKNVVKNIYESELPEGHIEKTHFKVRKLQFQSGDKIKESLKKIGASFKETGIENGEFVSVINSVDWIESINAMVFTGSTAAIEKIEGLIDTLDVPIKEVFIEMLVIETSVNNALNISTDMKISGTSLTDSNANSDGSKDSIAFGRNAGIVSSSTDIDNAGNLISNKGQEGYFSIGSIGTKLFKGKKNVYSLDALLSVLETDGDSSLIMNPKIVVENGSSAEVFIGSNNRIIIGNVKSTSSTSADNTVTSNYDYKKIGARLNVTPNVGNSGIITLDIDQEISTLASGLSNAGENDPVVTICNTKSTTTRVNVPNNNFLILSGMITSDKSNSKKSIPCLGGLSLPSILGGSISRNDKKKNVMIFIRPHIIDSVESINDITKRHREYIINEYENKLKSIDNNDVGEFLETIR